MHSYLILIYNESVFDTTTYKTLIKMLMHTPHEATLYIWDNSPEAQCSLPLKSEVNTLNINYYHSAKNEKLSIVYNKVMALAFEAESRYITILDQDSFLDLNFKNSINNITEPYLLLPKVCSDRTGKLISPRYQRYNYLTNHCQINYATENIMPGKHSSHGLFAVGSGMTITKELWLSKIQFRECLSFYGVDTEFCADYAKDHKEFILLDTVINHNASNEYDEGYEKFKWRLTKYYEHWHYQLSEYTCLPSLLISMYVLISLQLVLLKNKLKRLFKLLLKNTKFNN